MSSNIISGNKSNGAEFLALPFLTEVIHQPFSSFHDSSYGTTNSEKSIITKIKSAFEH